MRLTFHGGAQSVTGANYLLETRSASSGQAEKILVDCGLFQGGNYCDLGSFNPFPYDLSKVNATFVTHAHIDHTGRLPKLFKDGYRGPVYSTGPTREFAELLLVDSEDILQREAEKHGCPDIYEVENIVALMKHWKPLNYQESINIGKMKITYYNAGHILGSGIIVVEAEGKRIAFSGDLGNSPNPILPDLESLEKLNIDYCLVESAYGNRLHEDASMRKDLLEDAIEETVKGGGTIMIPAFAMERTQALLFELNELVENGRIPRVPIFMDSPLAIKLTGVYRQYRSFFNKDAGRLIKEGDEIFNFPGLKTTLTTRESREINDYKPPKIIIAGAGMMNGGRILHHARRYLSDPKNTILFIGYQAENSLGRRILGGAKSVRIFDDNIPVRCRVKEIGGYSAHADQRQLLDWLRPMRKTLKKVFVVQGDKEVSKIFAQKIIDELAIEATAPKLGESVVL